MDVEGLSDAAEGIMIMSSREVVPDPRVNIANTRTFEYRNMKLIFRTEKLFA